MIKSINQATNLSIHLASIISLGCSVFDCLGSEAVVDIDYK
jgi:hypothetical protein